MIKETALTLTVDRAGILDLLGKTKIALQVTASFMRSTNQVVESIVAEVLGAYIEALASALEQDLDEVVVQQLEPLILTLAEAGGDETLAESGEILQGQIREFIEMIELVKGKKEPNTEPLMIDLDDDTIH